jgi:hypothetical protein
VRELAVGEGAIALDTQMADAAEGWGGGDGHEDSRRCAAMGVDVRAAVIGARLAVSIFMVVLGAGALQRDIMVVGAAQRVVHVLMNERVRLGKLGRMQNGKLASAEHRHGKQHTDHYSFHERLHAGNRPLSAPFVKSGTDGETSAAVI